MGRTTRNRSATKSPPKSGGNARPGTSTTPYRVGVANPKINSVSRRSGDAVEVVEDSLQGLRNRRVQPGTSSASGTTAIASTSATKSNAAKQNSNNTVDLYDKYKVSLSDIPLDDPISQTLLNKDPWAETQESQYLTSGADKNPLVNCGDVDPLTPTENENADPNVSLNYNQYSWSRISRYFERASRAFDLRINITSLLPLLSFQFISPILPTSSNGSLSSTPYTKRKRSNDKNEVIEIQDTQSQNPEWSTTQTLASMFATPEPEPKKVSKSTHTPDAAPLNSIESKDNQTPKEGRRKKANGGAPNSSATPVGGPRQPKNANSSGAFKRSSNSLAEVSLPLLRNNSYSTIFFIIIFSSLRPLSKKLKLRAPRRQMANAALLRHSKA